MLYVHPLRSLTLVHSSSRGCMGAGEAYSSCESLDEVDEEDSVRKLLIFKRHCRLDYIEQFCAKDSGYLPRVRAGLNSLEVRRIRVLVCRCV